LSYKKGEGDRVRKSLLKLLCAVAALMLSTTVFAVGMGGINVTSALGQPLKADIELVAISRSEKDSLVARLASPDAYKSAGLEYPYGNNFRFKIESRADGRPYISASSAQPVNDPFVSLLIELSWSAGKLSREYTFLLDPPGYVAEQPAKAQVQAVAPEVQSAVPEAAASAVPVAPEESAVTSALQPAPVVAVTPEEEQAAPETEEQTAPLETAAKPEEQAVPGEAIPEAQEQAASAVAAAPEVKETLEGRREDRMYESVEVHRGDTMYKIAERYKQADMNLDRMLVALYRANAGKFEGRNMNRIRAGKILNLPTQDQYDHVTLPEALKEIHAQAADWNAYREKLASAASVSNISQDAQQVATGKISSSIADMAPVAKESAKEVLKLSKGEAPGDQVGTGAGGKSMSEEDKKNAAQEDAIAKSKALKEQQERAALLEKNMQDMQRLAQLKAEAAAIAQPPAPAPAKSAVSVATTLKPAPAAVPPKPKQIKPEPSLVDQILALVDQILDEPLYLGGGAAALLLLGGIAFMLKRRKKNAWIEEDGRSTEDVGEITGRMAAPVMPSPDTGDFTGTTSQAAAAPQPDNVDPISEADLFLNFGRDVQAEEILKEALQSMPNNHQIHLKLLGIYAARKDANSFSTIARQLQGSGDDDAWQQAVAMGRKLEPDNPMYGGGFRSMEDTGSATVQMPAFKAAPGPENVPKEQPSALDFDFDVGASAAQEAPSPEQDFLDATQKTSIMTADGNLVAQGMEMDFDITSTNPSMPETEAEKPADDGAMAFTLDFPVEKATEKPAAAVLSDIGLAGISLNFDDLAAPSGPATEGSAAASKGDQWQEVETKLDLAKAYHEMGDLSGAREILEEVLREGDNEQREAAQNLIVLLG
jgi:pilus assembly protein FimV